MSDAQEMYFGMRLFEAYGLEAKAQKLLKTKVFKHAAQLPEISVRKRAKLAKEILENGAAPTKENLTALAQAKLAYCKKALELTLAHGGKAFASIVHQDTIRPDAALLRKDYVYLFERFYYFLNSQKNNPMGFLVFDELDKSASHILLNQVSSYFVKTRNGRRRSKRIIPEPMFVHSDMTTMVQITDLLAYIISWGLRLRYMTEPNRPELEDFANLTMKLNFKQKTDSGRINYGFKVIGELSTSN